MKVLDFAQALVFSLPKGTPGKQLLRFAGVIEPDDIQAMIQAIEVGCERVDADDMGVKYWLFTHLAVQPIVTFGLGSTTMKSTDPDYTDDKRTTLSWG